MQHCSQIIMPRHQIWWGGIKQHCGPSVCLSDIDNVNVGSKKAKLYTLCPKMRPPFYFLSNSVKKSSFKIIFGVLNPEKI